MKIPKIYGLLSVLAMLLCGSVSSCSKEDLTMQTDDEMLPPGSYPLELVASVGGMQSRSGSKDTWRDGDEIGVRLISISNRKHNIIGHYKLNSEGTVKAAVGRYRTDENNKKEFLDDSPLEWPYKSGTVTAWFPFEPQINIAIDDQSKGGIYQYDYLSAVTDRKTYKDVIDLEFKHQMAKVTCRVIPDDGITPEEFETLWLRLQGHTSCTFRETELTGGENIGWITPDSTYNYADGSLYEALLVPNEMTGKDLISIGLKTNYEGNIIPKHFTYPSPKIEAGMHYTYNITVKKDRIEVSFFKVEWNDEGAGQHEPTRFTFRVNLTPELADVVNRNLVELSANVKQIKNESGLIDKFDVTGNEFTMNISATKETRSKNLVLIKNEAVNNPRVVNQSGIGSYDTYVENRVFLIADETTVGYKDELNVGDYFFSDGSWSSVLGWSGVQCVGIVFAVNNGDNPSVFKLTDDNGNEFVADKADDYTDNPIKNSNRIRGYVLALKDAIRETTLYKKGSKYPASKLTKDIRVSWAETDTVYKKDTKYSKGTLMRDLKVVTGESEKVYRKDTEYAAGTLENDIRVVWTAMETVYNKDKTYSGGTLISDVILLEPVNTFPWSPLEGAFASIGAVCSFDTDLFDGFANMVSVKGNVGKELGSDPVPPFDKLEALAEAEAYPVKAPAGTSGWYLPSIKQLQTALDYFHKYDNNHSESPIMKAAGEFPDGQYWSSTIGYLSGNTLPGFNAHTYDYNNPANPLSMAQIVYSSTKHVRAVLTF